MVYKFFGKNSKGGSVNNEIKQSQQLVEELHKPNTRTFKERKIFFFISRQYLGRWFSWYKISKQV